MLLMAIATIVSTGAASYISRSLGKKDQESANRTLTTGILICVALAIAVMVLGLIFIKPLIIALGASEEVYPYAYQYVAVMLIGSIPVMLNYAGGQLLRSEGAAMPSITGMMIGTVVNIVLDPIFIFTFKMGILGAGIATVLGNAASMVYYMWFYLSGKSVLQVKPKFISTDKTIWKEIFLIGIPAFLSQLLTSVGMLMTFGIGVVLSVIFWFGASGLVSVFTPLPEVIKQGTIALRINLFSFLILGPQMLASTGIQAFGKAKESLILSVARQGIIYIPLLFVMKSLLGFNGLIWAQPIADTITLGIGLIFLAVILNKVTTEKDESDKINKVSEKLIYEQ